MPENELWQLYRAAYEQYQCEIIKGEKKYSRFVNDFIAYHLPTLCTHEDQIRLHVMHVFSIKELLEERCDLVDYFFSRENFEEKDYRQMELLFNTGSTIESGKKRLANFTEEQIRLITEFAKSTKLFRQDVSEEDMANLFNCQLLTPLQANVNRHVALFFGALRQYGLLPFSWQMIIEENKLISSSANNQPLRASNLRCGLSQAKNTKLAKEKSSLNRLEDIGFEATCNAFVKKLKESM